MRSVIWYVLQDQKVREGYVTVQGPFNYNEITVNNVYHAFLDEKELWNKDSGRMCFHSVISFHEKDYVTPAEVLEIGQTVCDRFFSGFQNLLAVHQDKDHLHVHIVTNTVSFTDGHKLHTTKNDLQRLKDITNEICEARGLPVAVKGRHFDGSEIEPGEIIAWDRSKYEMLINEEKESYMIDCAEAIVETVPKCDNSDDFVARMELRGWLVSWNEKKGHIVFRNTSGKTLRDTNLSRTFTFNIGLEEVLNEFTRTITEFGYTQGASEEFYARKIGELILFVADLLFNALKEAVAPDPTAGKKRGNTAAPTRTARDERAKFDAFLASIHSRARAGQDDANKFIHDAGAAIEDSRAYRREREASERSRETHRRSWGPELG